MNKEKFFNQKFTFSQSYWEKVINYIWKYIDIWNQYSNISYFQYRNELKNISRLNFESIQCKIVDDLEGQDYIFLHVDDDDWFHYNIYDIIRDNINNETDVVVWNHTIITNNKIIYGDNNSLHTNNFAFTKKGVDKIKQVPDYVDILNQEIPGVKYAISPFSPHYDMNYRIFKKSIQNQKPDFFDFEKKDIFNIVKIEDRISATNKTLASASVLMRLNNNFDFYQRLLKLENQKINIFNWLKKQEEMYNQLHSNVSIKKIKVYL